MHNDRHLFIVSSDCVAASRDEEVMATAEGLREMGLYRLPYGRVSVQMGYEFLRADETLLGDPRVNADGSLPLAWRGVRTIFHDLTVDGYGRITMEHDGDEHFPPFVKDMTDQLLATKTGYGLVDRVRDGLVCLLATRNAVKETIENKRARLGIGKPSRRRWRYITTIRVPALETMESVGTGTARAPHLRRGHIRRQRHGPANQHIKLVWIDPVFVNADADFINTREAYHVTPGRKAC